VLEPHAATRTTPSVATEKEPTILVRMVWWPYHVSCLTRRPATCTVIPASGAPPRIQSWRPRSTIVA
jgi:hypothetical protein